MRLIGIHSDTSAPARSFGPIIKANTSKAQPKKSNDYAQQLINENNRFEEKIKAYGDTTGWDSIRNHDDLMRNCLTNSAYKGVLVKKDFTSWFSPFNYTGHLLSSALDNESDGGKALFNGILEKKGNKYTEVLPCPRWDQLSQYMIAREAHENAISRLQTKLDQQQKGEEAEKFTQFLGKKGYNTEFRSKGE